MSLVRENESASYFIAMCKTNVIITVRYAYRVLILQRIKVADMCAWGGFILIQIMGCPGFLISDMFLGWSINIMVGNPNIILCILSQFRRINTEGG